VRGIVAKKLRKIANSICSPRVGFLHTKNQWHPESFMAVYRRLKKEYKK